MSQIAKAPGRPRDEEVRKRILDSSAQLLEQRCFDEITVDAIAEQSGAGKATVYRWWPNKAAVLIEAFRDVLSNPFTGGTRLSLAQRSEPILSDENEELRRTAYH